MPRKKKHPKDMTSEEALKHVFHPKIVKHVKKLLDKHNAEMERAKELRKKRAELESRYTGKE